MDASICPMETSMKATGETLNTGSESICKTGSGWEFDVADCFLWLWYLAQVTSVPTLEEQQQKRVFTTFSRIQVKLEAIKDDIDKLTFGGEGDNDLRDFKKVEDSDATYEGEWLNGKKDGYGRQLWKCGDTYNGQWKNNCQSGWGKNTWADGSFFIGQYCNDLKHGIGEYVWEDGTMYIGEWKDNLIHGIGRYRWPDGRQYTGEWRLGLMQGYGVFEYLGQKRYEGGWFAGKKHGQGVTAFPDKKSSSSVWRAGKIVSS